MGFEKAFSHVRVTMALVLVAASLGHAITLDEAIEKLRTHKFGQNDEALNFLRESAVRSHSDAELRKRLNDGLVGVLASDAAYDAKQFACRQLALTATTEHIPVLARHLTDEKMSHMALYVLTHIESPEVDKALLAALDKAAGRARLGIINMLGSRRSIAAIKPLGKLMVSADQWTAVQAVKALGRIGTESALEQLGDYKRRTDIDSQALTRAYLDCADRILADGKPERAWATYLSVFRSSAPGHLRGAALKGLAQADTKKAIPSILEALSGHDKALVQMATHLAAGLPGKDLTRTLAGRLSQLGPHAQVTLLHAMAVRGDEAALDAVTDACNSKDEAVRIAALQATGTLGDASTVRFLAEHAARARGAELEAARAALSRCTSGRGEDINSAMVEQLQSVDDAAKVELITALALRNAVEATPAILETASSGSASVRTASYRALRNLAGADDVAALFDLLVAAGKRERDEVVKTIASVARRCSIGESASTIALKKLDAAKDVGLRTFILALLGDLGDGRALPILKSALNDSDERIQDVAVRSLSGWATAGPEGEPMDELLRIARTSTNAVHRVLALRGYINLISTAGNLSPSQKVDACKTAMRLAEGLSEKRRVLAKVAQIKSIEAFDMAESYLADQDLKAEAAVAATTIAESIYPDGNREHLIPVRAAMQQVLALDVPSFVLDKARKVISDIDAIKDYLTDWQVAGPYMQQGKGGLQLFDIPFGPELPDAHVQWKPMPVSTLGQHPAYLDLLKELNGGEQRVAYLRTTIQSEDQRSVRLEIYSDDGVKAWLNGKVVHANNCYRPIGANPDSVNVTLKKGPNKLMLKITQNNMPWGAIVLLREIK